MHTFKAIRMIFANIKNLHDKEILFKTSANISISMSKHLKRC